MKHATDDALDALTAVLDELRTVDGLTEKKRGIFYRGPRAFLHFHEDPAGLFADVRLWQGWERMLVSTTPGQRKLLASVRRELTSSAVPANPRKSAGAGRATPRRTRS
jgi:hypothetical protein